MANTIKLAHSHVSGEEPDTLDAGEVAINTNNQKIWVGNGTGNTLMFNHASYASSGHSHSVGDGGFTQKNFTSTLKSKLDGIADGATNTAAPYYTSAIAVGDGGLTQKNFTSTLKEKLDGIAANANNYSLPAAGNGTRGGVKLGYTESGQFYPVEAHGTSEKLYVNVPWQNTTYAVQDGGLTQKNFTSTLKDKLDGIAANATNTAAPYYTSAIAVGDGGLTQNNFTNTLKGKLDGIATGANNYTLPAGSSTVRGGFKIGYTESGKNYPVEVDAEKMFVNVPWTNTTYSEGDHGLTQANFTDTLRTKLNGIATNANNYALPAGSATVRGGFKIGYTESGKNYPVEVSSEKMYVNVPWTDNNTTYSVGDGGLTQKNFTSTLKEKLDGIAASANNYSLPAAGDGTRGGVKLGYTESGQFYPVEAHGTSEKLYVNVPWQNTTYSIQDGGLTQKNFTSTLKSKLDGIAANANNYSLPAGSSTVRGGFKIGYTESGKNYPVEVDAEKMYVNVPWTNTTYSVGDGGLTQKNFTSTLKEKLDGIAANATNTAAPYYTSAISVGDGGLTQKNFTSTLKEKLDGIATSANNYSLPAGSSTVRGGFKIGYAESGKNYPVEVSTEKMYVNVPWTNTTYSVGDGGLTQNNFTDTLKSKLDGIAEGATNTTDTNTWRPVEAGGNTLASNETLEFKAGNGIAISETGGEVTLDCTVTDTNTWRPISDSVTATSSTTSASSTAVKAAYDRSWSTLALGTTSTTAHRGDHGGIAYTHSQVAHAPSNAEANRSISDSVTSDSSTTSASSAAAKAAYDRSWPNNHREIYINGSAFLNNSASGNAFDLRVQSPLTFTYTSGGIVIMGHESGSGQKHLPSGGATNQFVQYSSSGTGAWATVQWNDLEDINDLTALP